MDWNFTKVNNTLSPARLSTYMNLAEQNEEKALLLYIWNVKLSQSLYLPLQIVEISLRNTVSNAIGSCFGKNWFQRSNFIGQLNDTTKDILEKAKSKCNNLNSLETDDIVPHLPFGFWLQLLTKKFEKHIWRRELSQSFPHISQNITVDKIYQIVNKINSIRNRIAHHEPIISKELDDRYQDMLRIIGFICEDTKIWVIVHSEFPDIYEDFKEVLPLQLDQFKEGQVVKGVVYNLTEYGVFLRVSNFNALLHIRDIKRSYVSVKDMNDLFKVNQSVEAKIIKIDKPPQKFLIRLSTKDLENKPIKVL